jgi:hypothetical protein
VAQSGLAVAACDVAMEYIAFNDLDPDENPRKERGCTWTSSFVVVPIRVFTLSSGEGYKRSTVKRLIHSNITPTSSASSIYLSSNPSSCYRHAYDEHLVLGFDCHLPRQRCTSIRESQLSIAANALKALAESTAGPVRCIPFPYTRVFLTAEQLETNEQIRNVLKGLPPSEIKLAVSKCW